MCTAASARKCCTDERAASPLPAQVRLSPFVPICHTSFSLYMYHIQIHHFLQMPACRDAGAQCPEAIAPRRTVLGSSIAHIHMQSESVYLLRVQRPKRPKYREMDTRD